METWTQRLAQQRRLINPSHIMPLQQSVPTLLQHWLVMLKQHLVYWKTRERKQKNEDEMDHYKRYHPCVFFWQDLVLVLLYIRMFFFWSRIKSLNTTQYNIYAQKYWIKTNYHTILKYIQYVMAVFIKIHVTVFAAIFWLLFCSLLLYFVGVILKPPLVCQVGCIIFWLVLTN